MPNALSVTALDAQEWACAVLRKHLGELDALREAANRNGSYEAYAQRKYEVVHGSGAFAHEETFLSELNERCTHLITEVRRLQAELVALSSAVLDYTYFAELTDAEGTVGALLQSWEQDLLDAYVRARAALHAQAVQDA